MKRPDYIEGLLSVIFGGLGGTFIAFGILSLVGLLKPKDSSLIQEPMIMGIFFASLGGVFCIIALVFKLAAARKNTLHTELIGNGIRVHGTVERVIYQHYTRYGTKSPYRIVYQYRLHGRTLHGKSHLLWDKPTQTAGDAIEVFLDETGRSAIQL